MLHETRIKVLNTQPIADGSYVLYWMQASQRTEYNHALEYAVTLANSHEKPLLVYFALTEDYPEANVRHYTFMLEGLDGVQKSLVGRGIDFVLQIESPVAGVLQMSEDASVLVTDRGYLKHQREWRERIAARAKCRVVQVETDVVVPVEVASPKEEYTAGTFRPKISRVLEDYLQPLEEQEYSQEKEVGIDSLDVSTDLLDEMDIDMNIGGVDWLVGGTSEAEGHLSDFLEIKIEYFDDYRNDPSKDFLSNLSPYLHFGQISPLYVALEAKKYQSAGLESFLEELIVRRELSMNFCHYDSHYDSLDCLPDWARTTLREHEDDHREYLYSLAELENAETHDDYWNAAQTEMVRYGKMHGYMRMYWGKKILEWTGSPDKAHNTALYLNNKYELDGRDPNGYTGVAWCFGKHDRAWKERPIFGKVRYMNANGLRRKFDIEAYVRKVS